MASLFEYKSSQKSVTLTKYIGTDNNVVVPKKIDDLPVTIIGKKCFANREDIISISMSDSVKEIGEEAFLNCTNLTQLDLSKKITKVGNAFLKGCKHLGLIKFYSLKFTPRKEMFEGCSGFLRVCCARPYSDNVFEGYSFYDIARGECFKYTYEYDFDYDPNGREVKLSSNGYYYFLDEDGNAVLTHGENKYDFKHKQIKLPEQVDNIPVVAIGTFAFSDLTFYTMEIPKTIKYIASLAFYNCKFALMSFPKKVNHFSGSAFGFSTIIYPFIRSSEDKLVYNNFVNMPTDISCPIALNDFNRTIKSFAIKKINLAKGAEGETGHIYETLVDNPLMFDETSKTIYYVKKGTENNKYAVIVSTLNPIESLEELPKQISSIKVKAFHTNLISDITSMRLFLDYDRLHKDNYLDDYDYKYRNLELMNIIGENENKKFETYIENIENPKKLIVPDFIDEILSLDNFALTVNEFNYLVLHDHMKVIEGLELKPYMHFTESVERAKNNGGIIFCDGSEDKNYDKENDYASYIYDFKGEKESGSIKYVLIDSKYIKDSIYQDDEDLNDVPIEALVVDAKPVDNTIFLPENVDGYPVYKLCMKITDKNIKNIYFEGKKYANFTMGDNFDIQFGEDVLIDNAYFYGFDRLYNFSIKNTFRGHIKNIIFNEGLEYITDRSEDDLYDYENNNSMNRSSDEYYDYDYDEDNDFENDDEYEGYDFEEDEEEYEDYESEYEENEHICVYLPKSLKLIENEDLLRNPETLYISKNTKHKQPFNSYNVVNYYEDSPSNVTELKGKNVSNLETKNNKSKSTNNKTPEENDGSFHCEYVCGEELQIDKDGSASLPEIVKVIKRAEFRDSYVFFHQKELSNDFSSVQLSDRRITAKYQGSDPTPYDVSVYLDEKNHIEGTCTCMSYNRNSRSQFIGCKHIAALANKFKEDNIFETKYYSNKSLEKQTKDKKDEEKYTSPTSTRTPVSAPVYNSTSSAITPTTNNTTDVYDDTYTTNDSSSTTSNYSSVASTKSKWPSIVVFASIIGGILLFIALICLFSGKVIEASSLVYEGRIQKPIYKEIKLYRQIGWFFYLLIVTGFVSWMSVVAILNKKFICYGVQSFALFIAFIISATFKSNNTINYHPNPSNYDDFDKVILSLSCDSSVTALPWLLFFSFAMFAIATFASFMEYREK